MESNVSGNERFTAESGLLTTPKSIKELHNKDWWIADTGATTHITCDPSHLMNVKDKAEVKLGLMYDDLELELKC